MAIVSIASAATVVKVLPLRSSIPDSTAFSRRAGTSDIAQVDATAISSWLFVAAIASEDQSFAIHHGIDMSVTADLAGQALEGETTRGGSTIPQQLARNLWLSSDRSWYRKGVEAWLALGLDRMLTKAREMELYVNVVDWGQGTFGICSAAWRFFGVAPSALTKEQAALLVTALPDPADRDPGSPDDLHRRLATALLIRIETVPRYFDASILEEVGLPLYANPAVAAHPCDQRPRIRP